MKRYINQIPPFEGNVVFLDTETNGTDAHSYRVWSVQLTDGISSILLTRLNEFTGYLSALLSDKTMVAHSAAFDIKVLWNLGIYPTKVHDTLNIEKILYSGRYFSFGLKDVLKRRDIAELSKEERKVFYDGTFDTRYSLTNYSGLGSPESIWMPEDINYALEDIEYLPQLYREQMYEIETRKLENLANVENEYVLSAAALEWNGIRMNVAEAHAFSKELEAPREELREKVNAVLSESYLLGAMEEYDRKMAQWLAWSELWNPIKHKRNEPTKEEIRAAKPFKNKPKEPTSFNIASPAQLKLALRGLGVYTDSTAHDTLVELAGESPVIEDLLSFREYDKLIQLLSTSYEKVNPVTGNIHPEVNQNVVSGRQSYRNPNLQQIPNKSRWAERFRSLFQPHPGNVLVIADYPAFELIYLGIASKDKSLLHALQNEKDLHCYTMSKFLGLPEATPLIRVRDGQDPNNEEVHYARLVFDRNFNISLLRQAVTLEEWVDKLRMIIKTMTYGLSYGLSAFGVARKFGCLPQVGEQLVNTFFTTYPDLRVFLNDTGKFAERNFVTPRTRLGRSRYFQKVWMPSFDQEINNFLAAGFDQEDAYKYAEEEFKIKRKEYNQKIGRIRRQAGNFMPQASNADATKLASVYFNRRYEPMKSAAKIVLSVHDELVVECPACLDIQIVSDLKECMEKAADYVTNSTGYIKVKPVVSERWKK